jgi:hypothetical protein
MGKSNGEIWLLFLAINVSEGNLEMAKGGGTQTTTQTNEPPAYLQPYLAQGAAEAQRLYSNPTEQFYPGSTVVPFSNETNQSLDMTTQRALAGSPVSGAANQNILETLQGNFLSQGNPYLQAAFQPVIRNYNETVLPGIESVFSKAGRYGSGAQAAVTGQANQDLAGALSGIAYQNYDAERQRQQAAAALAPALAQQDYYDAGQLAAVGATKEGLAANQLQEQIERFNFDNNRDQINLQQFLQNLQGSTIPGAGVSTAITPKQSQNRLLSGLGGAASGASLGAMFGPYGALAGGALGLGLGAFG